MVAGSVPLRVAECAAWREFPRDVIASRRGILPATAPDYPRTIFWRKTALSPDHSNNTDAFGLRGVSVVPAASCEKKN